ncbi:hypothetical protein ACTXT7_004004 [Hymenolepis weldensis]
MRACVRHEYISLRSPIAALHTFLTREVGPPPDELAAKLSAGPGFPFGPPRLGVVSPPATVNHSAVASGDTTPASLSPGSPSTSGPAFVENNPRLNCVTSNPKVRYGSREGYLGGSAGDSDGIKDSYMEGAMLRINLNRQRKHRVRTNQSSTASPAAAAAVTPIPLHRISEVDTADSLTGRNNIHSSPQHSPLSFPKPKILLKSSKLSSEANEEMTVVPHSPKTQFPTISTAGLGAAESTEHKPPANPYENVFTEERAQEKEDQETLSDPSNAEPKSLQVDGEIVTGSRLGSSSSRSSARSQEEGEKGGSEGQESPSHSPMPSPSVTRSSNGAQIRSLGESDDKFPTQGRFNRTVSTPVGFSPQYQLKRINSGGNQQEGSPIAVPSKVEEETEEKGNSEQKESSSPSVASPPSVVASEVEESKEKLPAQGFLSVRLRSSSNRQNPINDGVRVLSSVGEENTNRHSRVCDLVKVFQQQQSGAT